MLVAVGLREQRLLRDAALVPQRLQLPGVDAVAFPLEALLHEAGEGEVHVVAAEQDVIADRDALEREVAVVLADEDQAEVGRAAADVAHQHAGRRRGAAAASARPRCRSTRSRRPAAPRAA